MRTAASYPLPPLSFTIKEAVGEQDTPRAINLERTHTRAHTHTHTSLPMLYHLTLRVVRLTIRVYKKKSQTQKAQ